MPSSGLWMLGASADSSSAETRRDLAERFKLLVRGRSDRILLETCHRVELYGSGPPPDLPDSATLTHGGEAAKHLARVAAGLESAIVGEDEVLHQVRQALTGAITVHPVDSRLRRLFETSIAIGRRTRSRRLSSSGNLAQSAVNWLGRKAALAGRELLVVGAGHMGAALAHAAQEAGAKLIIASRDESRAARLARVYGVASTDLNGAVGVVSRCAAVAIALAGPWEEIASSAAEIPPVADISAPPSLPGAVRARLNGGYLGIDDLFVRGRRENPGYIAEALPIIENEINQYLDWLASRP